jgi:two-component system, OmpR family, response regulator MprA
VILDVGLPDTDGLALCRRLRRAGNRVPVLMVSARGSIEHRIDGLESGADDDLPKPFDVGELRARLRALVRRAGDGAANGALAFAELRLDRERHGVWVHDEFLELGAARAASRPRASTASPARSVPSGRTSHASKRSVSPARHW